MLKISLLYFLLFGITILRAQGSYFALITEPQIGIPENAENLISVINDINDRDEVSQVIVLGNITANGKFDEFVWAQEILDGLNIPYFVVGGEKDYFLSEGKGSEISLLWGNDKKVFHTNNFSSLSINSILPGYSNKNYIEAESLVWIENELNKSNSKRIITFSYYTISKAENSYKFYQFSLDQNLFSFVSKYKNSSNEIPTFEGFYLNRNNDWGYLLVSVKKDSIYINKIIGEEIKKKVKPENIKLTFAPITLYESIKPIKLFSSLKEIWSVEMNKTLGISPVYADGKIIAGFKNGVVKCLNQSGLEIWSYNSQGRIFRIPIIEKDITVVSTAEGDILTLNSNNGELVQVIGIGENITSDISIIDIEENGVKRKAIIAGTVYGNLYCYDLYTLEPIWTAQITSEPINSSIAFSNNKVVFQDKSGTLYCLSAGNGLLIWKIEASQTGWTTHIKKSELAVKNFDLYLTDAIGNLFCIDVLLGKVKWNLKNINGNGLIRFYRTGDLLIPAKKNEVISVTSDIGKVKYKIDLLPDTKSESITDVTTINDKIFISFSNGWVYSINSKKKVEKIFLGGSAPAI
jgi:outer membrane protein assembly factor BamB